MKKIVCLAIPILFLTACITSKNKMKEINEETETVVLDSTFMHLERADDISVRISLPGDPEIPRNYKADTSHYNVFNVTYKETGNTQVLVLPESWSVNDMVSLENLSKIDTLQTNVRLVDVLY
jgi:PBP1b-binding outer membrane lipoprotein LpoB